VVSKKVKIWGGVAAGVLVLSGIGSLVGPPKQPSTPPVVAATPSASPSVQPTPEAKASSSPEPAYSSVPAEPSHLAKDVEKAWLENMMVDKPVELLDTLPNSLAGYVTSFEDVTTGTIEITVQTNDATKAELKKFSQSVFSLVGSDFPDLERVEAVSADKLTRGVTNRREVPLLNQ